MIRSIYNYICKCKVFEKFDFFPWHELINAAIQGDRTQAAKATAKFAASFVLRHAVPSIPPLATSLILDLGETALLAAMKQDKHLSRLARELSKAGFNILTSLTIGAGLSYLSSKMGGFRLKQCLNEKL